MKNSVRGRNTDKLATVCNDNVRPYSRGYICRIGITREGTREKKTFVSEKKKKSACACTTLGERKNRDRARVQENPDTKSQCVQALHCPSHWTLRAHSEWQ